MGDTRVGQGLAASAWIRLTGALRLVADEFRRDVVLTVAGRQSEYCDRGEQKGAEFAHADNVGTSPGVSMEENAS
jgi:hypothetical protein